MWNFPLFPDRASSLASRVDSLFFVWLGLAGLVAFAIAVLIVFFAVKYRNGSKANRQMAPPAIQRRRNHRIEFAWIFIPLGLFMVMFAWAAELYYEHKAAPDDAMEIYVIAKQWMWKLEHAGGQREIDELHVPVGRPIKLVMTSQDVIHSFFVPAFRVKQDVVPGKYTTEWFHPTRLGEYHLFCAEYCGTNHSAMIGRVVVMRPEDYQEWLSSGENGQSIAFEGRRLFHERGCSGCHEGSPAIRAPMLQGVYGKQVPLASGEIVTADDQYLRDSILLPGKQISAGYENVMPSFSGHISEAEIMKIIAYLKSTSAQGPARQ